MKSQRGRLLTSLFVAMVLSLFASSSLPVRADGTTGAALPGSRSPTGRQWAAPPTDEPQIAFSADRIVLNPGECTMLHWSVQGGYSVVLDGQQVLRDGEKEVCPSETSIYRLEVDAGGKMVRRVVNLGVRKGPAPTEAPPKPAGGGDPYADRIVSFAPGKPAAPQFGNPQAALGAPDFNEPALTGFLTLGIGGSVTLEFVDNVAVDGPGPDLEIDGDPANEELWLVEASTDGVNYRLFGKVPERAVLDLAQIGLPYARFVRITDDGNPSGGISPGAELDAVIALNSAPAGAIPGLPPPAQLQPPPPPPKPPQKVPTGADIQPTDLYADNQPQGQIWIRITNNGPATLTNKKVQITCNSYAFPLSGPTNVGFPMFYGPAEQTLNLAPGQTQTINMGWPIDTSKSRYQFTVIVQPKDFIDPNPNNNSYSEKVEPAGGFGPGPGPGPAPKPGPGGPGTVDLAVTDLYPDNLPQGKIWTRITNNGPAVLVNAPVELKCGGSGKPVANQSPWSHVEAPTVINISLKPGETAVVPTNVLVDTNQYNYDLWCAVWPKSFTESNDSNNKYSEKLVGTGGPQPQPPAPPGGGSGGITTADLAVTDLYPDNMPVGEVFARITNNGPSSVSNVGVQLGCSAVRTEYVGGAKSTHALAPGTTNITLSPGQTAAFDTNIRIEDSTKYWYKVTCTVQVPFKDPNPSNNSYTESIPPSP